MTWNINWFPKKWNTTIDYIAEIIGTLDIDVLAIQELIILFYLSMLDDFDMMVILNLNGFWIIIYKSEARN